MAAARRRRPGGGATARPPVNQPQIEAANRNASGAYLAAQPVLEGIGPAREALPGMGARMILHAGPPIAWAAMCGPMQGAIVGAILFEGWAEDAEAAQALAGSRRDRFRALPSPWRGRADGRSDQPLDAGLDRRNPESGNRACCNLNEGLGKALRFGANGQEVIARLHWMAEMLAPALRRGARGPGRARAEAADGAGAAHGRRDPQPERRGLLPPAQTAGAGAAANRGAPRPRSRRRSTSSPATIISSSTSRWPPARRCSMPPTALPAAAW